jgi:hypothetical protein
MLCFSQFAVERPAPRRIHEDELREIFSVRRG